MTNRPSDDARSALAGAQGGAPGAEGAPAANAPAGETSREAALAPRPQGRHFRTPADGEAPAPSGAVTAPGAVFAESPVDADAAAPAAPTAEETPESEAVPESEAAPTPASVASGDEDAPGQTDPSSDHGTAPDADPASDDVPAPSVTGNLPPLPKLEEDPHAGLTKVRKKTHNRLKRRLKIAAIVLAIIAVLAGGAVGIVWALMGQGGAAMREAAQAEDLGVAEDASTEDEGQTVTYNGQTYRYNENIVSIVVIGTDLGWSTTAEGNAGQADAIMVVALDTETGSMRAIGIPRETMVDVDEHVGSAFIGQDKMQLSLAYNFGDGYATSSENVVRAVSRILYNMPMTYYFTIQMDGVAVLNDAVGGVTVTPLASIPGTRIQEGVPITLLGSNAQRYVQYRDTSYLESSSDRQARQTQYLQAFFSQALATAQGNPLSLVELYRAVQQYSTTNLGIGEFTFLASEVVHSGLSNLTVTTLQGTQQKGPQFVEFYPDEANVYQTVLDTFYTPVDDVE